MKENVVDYLLFIVYVITYAEDKLGDFVKYVKQFQIQDIELPNHRIETLEAWYAKSPYQ